jgi:hypothetical protein
MFFQEPVPARAGTVLENTQGMETCRNVGFELWQARKAKGWSRAEASAVSKLRVGLLEALESNDLDALPPTVYLRRHLRTYARDLGLSPESVVTRYLDQFGLETPATSAHSVANSGWTLRPQVIAPLRRAALAAILVLVSLFFFNPSIRLSDGAETDAATVAPAPEIEVNASFGAVRETSRNIAISSRLSH